MTGRTSKQHVEEDDELVNAVADDISHHDRRHDVLISAVRLAMQKIVGRELSCQGQRGQRVLEQIDPDHLNGFYWRTLCTNLLLHAVVTG